MKRLATLAAATLALTACQDAPTSVPIGPERGVSPAVAAAAPDGYIVVFDAKVADAPGLARRLVAAHGGTLRFTYEHALRGFAARLPATAADALARNPNVAYVEPDRPVQLFGTQSTPPSWGLDRVDDTDLPLDASYTYPTTGAGVNAYILDTGVRPTHTDFGGRVRFVPNGSNGDFVGDGHGSAADCHGHGTHVAGTVGGAAHGVAKGVAIWAARVVNCSGGGNVSMAIAAVDWVTANAVKPAVVNMSLGYGDVQSLRDAVQRSIGSGITYAVAAGNGNFAGIPQDACTQSPAGAPDALTIGSTTSSDNESSFSNYGTCVDILAPGSAITSAWYTGDNATNTISGTSMATPHVAGVAALYLETNPAATAGQVAAAIKENGIRNTISLHSRSSGGGTPNLFLYTGFIGGGGAEPPANALPVASFTASCTLLDCTFTDGSTDSDGTVMAWRWNFGDGTESTDRNPAHTYAAPGSYSVTLTVTDDAGATDSETRTVTVSAACVSRGNSGKCR